MSLRAVVLIAAVGAPAAAGVGYWQGLRPSAVQVAPARATAPPLIVKPGWGAKEAAVYLASLNAPPPPPPAPPKVVAAVATGPDVAVQFRRDLSAVLNSPGAPPKVVLGSRRSLSPGDMYRDGWKLESVSSTSATLTKGADTRRIGLFSPPIADATVAAPPPAVRLALTNGLRPGEVPSEKIGAVVNALKAAGATEAQLAQLRTQMQNGQANQNTIIQLWQQMSRNPGFNPSALTSVLNAFASAGVITQQQIAQMTQILPQVAQQGAQQGAPARPVQIGGPGGPGGTRGAPGGGFNPGGGGFQGGGFNGGGRGGRGRGG